MKTKELMAWAGLPLVAALSLSACGDQESTQTAEPNIVAITEQDDTETADHNNTEIADQEPSETVYEHKTADGEATATFTHVGDKILKQHGVHKASYEAYGFASKEEAQEVLEPQIAQLNTIDEYEHTIEYGETHLTEELIANYDAMDPADVVKLPGMDQLDTTEDASFYSLEQTGAELEAQGYTKVE